MSASSKFNAHGKERAARLQNHAFLVALRKRDWGKVMDLFMKSAADNRCQAQALKTAAAEGQYDVVAGLIKHSMFFPEDLAMAEASALENDHRKVHALLHEFIETLPEHHRAASHKVTHPRLQARHLRNLRKRPKPRL